MRKIFCVAAFCGAATGDSERGDGFKGSSGQVGARQLARNDPAGGAGQFEPGGRGGRCPWRCGCAYSVIGRAARHRSASPLVTRLPLVAVAPPLAAPPARHTRHIQPGHLVHRGALEAAGPGCAGRAARGAGQVDIVPGLGDQVVYPRLFQPVLQLVQDRRSHRAGFALQRQACKLNFVGISLAK